MLSCFKDIACERPSQGRLLPFLKVRLPDELVMSPTHILAVHSHTKLILLPTHGLVSGWFTLWERPDVTLAVCRRQPQIGFLGPLHPYPSIRRQHCVPAGDRPTSTIAREFRLSSCLALLAFCSCSTPPSVAYSTIKHVYRELARSDIQTLRLPTLGKRSPLLRFVAKSYCAYVACSQETR
jgi:hypothetical protein